MRLSLAFAALATIPHAGAARSAAGDPALGEVVFQKCYACHSVVPGETGLPGPNLAGGRPQGRARAGLRLLACPGRPGGAGRADWTEAALDAFLRVPEAVAPGTAMAFVGLSDAAERADVIAFLKETL